MMMIPRRSPLLLAALAVLGVCGACLSAPGVSGLRRGESARETEALFPGTIPTDEEDRPTHVVTRFVDARTGEPLPGAMLDAVTERTHPAPAQWPPVRRAVADGDGWARLRVDDIRDEFAWYLVGAPEHAGDMEMEPPGTVKRLLPGADVPVEVRDRFDRPVPGVHLGLILGCGHTPDVRTTVTDEHGRAVLEDVEPDRGDLWPTKRGYKSPDDYLYFHPCWRPGDPPQVLRLTTGHWASGTVLDHEGRPAAGVRLVSHHRHRGPCGVADEQGRFLITGLDFRDSLNIYGPDDDYLWGAEVSPTADRMVIRLPAPGEDVYGDPHAVRVRVVDSVSGVGVEGVIVRAIRADYACDDRERTNEKGHAELSLASGEYSLGVEDDDGVFGSAHGRLVVPVPEGKRALLKVRRQPTVRVETEGFPDEELRKRDDFRTMILLATERGDRDVTKLVLAGESVPVPADAPWAFFVEVGDQELVVPGPETPSDEPVVLRAPRPHEVRVRLEDEGGRPVPGYVQLDRSPHWESKTAPVIATANWRVSTHFTGGHYWLIARPADEERFQQMAIEIELPAGEGGVVDAGTLRLRAANEPLLRVVHADGSPAANADVFLGNYSVYQYTELDENGELFESVTPLEGADLEISDPEQRHLPFEAHLEGSRPWTLVWPDGGLSLEVVDEEDRPLDEGFVVLVDGAMVRASSARHEVRGLSAGEHEVVIAAPGRKARVLHLRLAKDELRELRVTLRPVSAGN